MAGNAVAYTFYAIDNFLSDWSLVFHPVNEDKLIKNTNLIKIL